MMAERQFEETLNECLERLAAGATVEECLSQYPQAALELEPLLRVAQAAMGAGSGPRPEARAEVLARLTEAWEAQQAHGTRWRLPVLTAPALRPWAVAVMSLMLLVLGGWGTVNAAEESLPGDALYPVKQAQESLLLFVVPSSERKAKLHVRLAQRRVKEMESMADHRRDGPDLERLAQRMGDHAQRAVILLGGKPFVPVLAPLPQAPRIQTTIRVQGPPIGQRSRVRVEVMDLLLQQARQQERVQQRILPQMPEGLRLHFEQSFERSRRELYQAIQILEHLESQLREREEPQGRIPKFDREGSYGHLKVFRPGARTATGRSIVSPTMGRP